MIDVKIGSFCSQSKAGRRGSLLTVKKSGNISNEFMVEKITILTTEKLVSMVTKVNMIEGKYVKCKETGKISNRSQQSNFGTPGT
jgi:hypothetical protein